MGSKRKRGSRYTATEKAFCRSKITAHLFERGHQDNFTITPGLVKYWWRVLNIAVFNGMLPPPKHVLCRNFHGGCLGYCEPTGLSEDVTLGIRRNLLDRETFLTVLVHEMVHQYEWIVHREMTHSKTFYVWQDRINHTIGLPLDEYVD